MNNQKNMTQDSANDNKGPLLPVWGRVILLLIAYFLLSGLFQVFGALAAGIPFDRGFSMTNLTTEQLLIIQLFSFAALMIIVYIFRKSIDRKSIQSMGFAIKNRFPDIAAGFLFALFIIGGGTLILSLFGFIEIVDVQMNQRELLLGFVLLLVVAFGEEILVRGYILNNLLTTTNKYWALLFSAVIFALLHSLNFNLSLIGMTNLLLAGIILGATYIYTQNLWFPISLHLFWNFLQGPIFGYPVSGMQIKSITTIKLSGTELLNGGSFGFEGSVFCTLMTIIGIVAIIFYYQRKKE
jgi:membrane protease YdiL (CAAX protease family)